jgi:methylmalonyl-CoA/ethylmalonyl-CoA epimerase
MKPLFVAIDHVGIAVADLDEAVDWYQHTFGMTMVHQEVNEEQGVREAMLVAGTAGETQLQLLAPLRPDSPIARFLDRSGPGIQQIAYRVEDIEAVSAELQSRGLRLLYETPRRGTAGARINFIHPKDAGGVLIELIEPPA